MTGERRRMFVKNARPAGLFIALLLVVYSDPLFFRRNFGGRDLLAYNLPIESAIHDAYSRGRLPVWMPEISGGRPLLPNPNAGALYPVWALLSLVSFPLALRLFPLIHWALAGIGMLCLLRALRASAGAAWVAAVTYVFSGVAVSEVFFAHELAGLAFLPWVLWALARPAEARRKVLALSVLLALVLLSGDVFQIALVVGSALLWTVLEIERPARLPHLAALGFSGALAALAAAPQIVATVFWIPETGRAVMGMNLGESLQFSITPWRVLELLVPYPFGPTYAIDVSEFWTSAVFRGKAIGLFTSLYAGAFAVIGAWSVRRDRAPGARFGRALAAVALALAVLPSLIPASWRNIPSPLPLRNPEKFVVGLSLGLAILAGIAFDRFRRQPLRPRGSLLVAAVLALVALAAWQWTEPAGRIALRLVGERSGPAGLAGEKLSSAFAEAGLLWLATVAAVDVLGRPRWAAAAIAIFLLTAVPLAANRRIARTFSEETIFGPTPFARMLQRSDPRGEYRAIGVSPYRPASPLQIAAAARDPGHLDYSRRMWIDYYPALWRRGQVFNQDFDSGDLSRMQSLRRLSFGAAVYTDAEAFFGTLSLRWAVRFRDQTPLPGYRRIRGDGLMDWDEHLRPFPDIRLLTGWREEPDAIAALQAVPGLAPGEVAIETGKAGGHQSARRGRLTIFEKSPERLRLGVEAADPTWLFVLREFWTHRKVLVDGKPAETAPAQLAFTAVRLPAGRHAVEWEEMVPGAGFSRFGPVVFGLALFGISIHLRSRRRGGAPRG